MSETIDKFIEEYIQAYDFYKAVADLSAVLCEGTLASGGIRAIVTDRAKDPVRLRRKIMSRGRAYGSPEEIASDIVDLVGVRVALYYPGDMESVAAMFAERFEIVGARNFPQGGSGSQERRFCGYRATHLRAKLRPEDVPDPHFVDVGIEIQIATVYMHAWAEVDHDIVYKPVEGDPSADEVAVLDQLNGVSLVAEIALERLQRLTIDRREAENRPFTSEFALASFVHDLVAVKWPEKRGRIVFARELWAYLEATGRNTPAAVKEVLDGLQMDPDFNVPSQVTDQLVYGDLNAYRVLADSRASVWSWRPYVEWSKDEPDFVRTKRQFFVAWVCLQAGIRALTGQVPINAGQWEAARATLAGLTGHELFLDQARFSASVEEFRRLFHSHVAANHALLSEVLPSVRGAVAALGQLLGGAEEAALQTDLARP